MAGRCLPSARRLERQPGADGLARTGDRTQESKSGSEDDGGNASALYWTCRAVQEWKNLRVSGRFAEAGSWVFGRLGENLVTGASVLACSSLAGLSGHCRAESALGGISDIHWRSRRAIRHTRGPRDVLDDRRLIPALCAQSADVTTIHIRLEGDADRCRRNPRIATASLEDRAVAARAAGSRGRWLSRRGFKPMPGRAELGNSRTSMVQRGSWFSAPRSAGSPALREPHRIGRPPDPSTVPPDRSAIESAPVRRGRRRPARSARDDRSARDSCRRSAPRRSASRPPAVTRTPGADRGAIALRARRARS